MPEPSYEQPVPLADAEIAQHIAEAARAGRPVDRSPTIEQLLLPFGEDVDAGPASRVRVARALAIAGVGLTPADLRTVPGGTRVFLDPGPGPSRRRRRGRGRVLLLTVLVMALLLGGATGAALTLGDGRDGAAGLSPGGSSSAASAGGLTTSETETAATQAEADAAGQRRREAAIRRRADAAAAKKRRRARRARRERREREHRATVRRRRVVVTLVAAQPTYLCVSDGAGRRLFGGTLSGTRTFRAKRLRMNIGLSSVSVTAAGKRVALRGSPTGYLFQAGGKAPRYLPLGQRPDC